MTLKPQVQRIILKII